MSYKFEHKGKQYWAKEIGTLTEVHLLEKKGLSDIVLTLDKSPNMQKVIAALETHKS